MITEAHDALINFWILKKMSRIWISLTGNQKKKLCFFFKCFYLPFYLELSSTHVTSTTSYMYLFMCKRHLKHFHVKCVETILIKKEITKHMQDSISLFLIPVKDIKIADIFFQIQKFIRASWASVIAHKFLLHLIILM